MQLLCHDVGNFHISIRSFNSSFGLRALLQLGLVTTSGPGSTNLVFIHATQPSLSAKLQSVPVMVSATVGEEMASPV